MSDRETVINLFARKHSFRVLLVVLHTQVFALGLIASVRDIAFNFEYLLDGGYLTEPELLLQRNQMLSFLSRFQFLLVHHLLATQLWRSSLSQGGCLLELR